MDPTGREQRHSLPLGASLMQAPEDLRRTGVFKRPVLVW